MWNFEKTLFTLVLALGAVVLAIALWGTDSHPTAHPEFATMTQGGSGLARHDDLTLTLGWLFGTVILLTFGALMAFGARRRVGGQDTLDGLGRYLLGGIAAHWVVWTGLVLAYRAYLHDPSARLFFAFPAPTAIMLYLMLPVPLVFVAFFVLGFRRWVLTAEEQAAYERLLAAKQEREDAASRKAPGG